MVPMASPFGARATTALAWAALTLFTLVTAGTVYAAGAAAGFVRGDADCSLTRSAADVSVTVRGLGGTSACGNDDCDRDSRVSSADVACAAGCLFDDCPVPAGAPRVTGVTPATAAGIVPFAAIRITGINFGSSEQLQTVTIGGRAAEVAERPAADALLVIVPDLPAGEVSVVVSAGDLEGFPFFVDILAPTPIGVADTFAAMLDLLDRLTSRFAALDLESAYGSDHTLVREGLARFRRDLASQRATLAADPAFTAAAAARLDAAVEASGVPEQLRLLLADIEAFNGGARARDGAADLPTVALFGARLGTVTRLAAAMTTTATGGLPVAAIAISTLIAFLGGVVLQSSGVLAPFLVAVTYRTADGQSRPWPTAGGIVRVEGQRMDSVTTVLRVQTLGGAIDIGAERSDAGALEFRLPADHPALCGSAALSLTRRLPGTRSNRFPTRVQPELIELLTGTAKPFETVRVQVRGVGTCSSVLKLSHAAGIDRTAYRSRSSDGDVNHMTVNVPNLPPSTYAARVEVAGLASAEPRQLRIEALADRLRVDCTPTSLSVPPAVPNFGSCRTRFSGDYHSEPPSELVYEWSASDPQALAFVVSAPDNTTVLVLPRRPGRINVSVEAKFNGAVVLRGETSTPVDIADTTPPAITLETTSPATVAAGDSLRVQAVASDNVGVQRIRLAASGDAVVSPEQECFGILCADPFRVDIKRAGAFTQTEISLVATAFDAAGNQTTSNRLAFHVDLPAHTPTRTATNTATSTPTRTPTGGPPITPGDRSVVAYVTSEADGRVIVIDTATNTVLGTIPVQLYPRGVAFAPDGAFAYVVNEGSDTLSVIDTSSRTVVDTIVVGDGPWDLAVTPNGRFAYVGNFISENVSVVDLSSRSVVTTIPMRSNISDIVISANGSRAYVGVN